MISIGFTWTHLDSLGLTWTHLDSLGPTWIHLDPICCTRENGRRRGRKTKRLCGGKTKRLRPASSAGLIRHCQCASHARMKRNDFPVDSPPQPPMLVFDFGCARLGSADLCNNSDCVSAVGSQLTQFHDASATLRCFRFVGCVCAGKVPGTGCNNVNVGFKGALIYVSGTRHFCTST